MRLGGRDGLSSCSSEDDRAAQWEATCSITPPVPMKGTPNISVPHGRGTVQVALSGQPDVQSTEKREPGRDITYKVPALKHIYQEDEERKVQSRYLYLLCPLLLCNVSVRK